MTTDKAKKIKAFKELLEIAQSSNRYVRLHTDGSRSWPVEWEKDLGDGRFQNEKDQQHALNKVLEHFVIADFPSSVAQMDKERNLIRLTLDAGADPNYYFWFHGENIFDDFLTKGKFYAALEIANTDGFLGPKNTEKTFKELVNALNFYLYWKHPYPGTPEDTKERIALYAQDCSDQKNLVYTLFQQGIYPRDSTVFEKLVPIVLEKEPKFFEKKKQQVVAQLKGAQTPVQIFNALTGKKGGKNDSR